MKKRLITVAQILFGLALIAWLFYNLHQRGDLYKLKAAFGTSLSNPGWIAGALVAMLLCLIICSGRWYLLLRSQGILLEYRRVLMLYFIGHFFNSFMPGATSGDVLKAYYVTRHTPGRRTEAVSTVFIDRIIGLIALVGLTVVIMIVRIRFFLQFPETRLALAFNAILFAGTVTGILVVFNQRLFERLSVFRILEQKAGVAEAIRRIYQAFRVAFRTPGVLFQTTVLSLMNHLCFIGVSWCIGRSLELSPSFLGYLTVFPVINAVSSIPVTPGGLGTRETMAVFMLGTLGVNAAHAISLSLLLYAITLIMSLVGGLVYIAYSIIEGRIIPPGNPPANP
ncbi:MAG: hypothetical protein A2498_03205 [Lentisphaerae bacterium RIFOXYC12_FULL_60_16]|nr:MAG: hypothetical protein A2498_03205 [Lentisphaerae bacterium RIFOXYC12_FULL_60_16]OGV72041.1 MAG: hypothetical protein A2269_00080 [Lentisphaerae bacterium RIFOXYA12_FULL_60_10]